LRAREQLERKRRDEQRFKRQIRQRKMSEQLGRISWFWLSQTDIIPGYWATPWRCFGDLTSNVCVGAVQILIEALIHRISATAIHFEPFTDDEPNCALAGTIDWMRQGKSTYPAYAYGADGGVVCSGGYVSLSTLNFSRHIPAVPLLDSLWHQVNNVEQKAKRDCERRILELMRLDAWLSIVGRTPEISKGHGNLLELAAAYVQQLMDEFEQDFLDVHLGGDDEGVEMNHAVWENIVDFLEDYRLTDAEMFYVIVATLRTVKVGLCILTGSDTSILGEILEKDVQVHLV